MHARSTTATLLVVGFVVFAGCTGGTTLLDASTTVEPTTATLGTQDGTLAVHFIDVGQGSSTLLVGPTNETMLIDSGDWRDDGAGVIDYLQRRGIDRIDYLITTHADADHVGGHAAVIEYLETEGDGVGAVYDPGLAASTQTYSNYLDAVEEHDVTLYRTRTGDPIPFEGLQVDVLGPPEDGLAGEDRNENSLVIRVAYGQTSFLFPGDAAERGEAYLVRTHGSDLDSTVLLAGHHGSRSSSTAEFLDTVTPTVAVVSSAYDSQYGHPHEEVLDRFAARDVATAWTGIHGSLVLTANGTHVATFAQARATTDPLELRSAPAFSGDDASEFVQIGVVAATEDSAVVTDGGSEWTPTGQTPTDTPDAPSATGALAVETIHADAAGAEAENFNDEYVVFTNTGESSIDLSGWAVEDEAGHEYVFPDGFTLDPGDSVTLHTGSGTDSSTDLYWDSGQPVWNNDDDTVIVTSAEGEVVIEEAY